MLSFEQLDPQEISTAETAAATFLQPLPEDCDESQEAADLRAGFNGRLADVDALAQELNASRREFAEADPLELCKNYAQAMQQRATLLRTACSISEIRAGVAALKMDYLESLENAAAAKLEALPPESEIVSKANASLLAAGIAPDRATVEKTAIWKDYAAVRERLARKASWHGIARNKFIQRQAVLEIFRRQAESERAKLAQVFAL